MVADLDDRWKEMIAAQAELRRLLMDKLNGLAAAEKAAATDDGLAAAEKEQPGVDRRAAAAKSWRQGDLLAKASGGAAAPAIAAAGRHRDQQVARAFDGVLESGRPPSTRPRRSAARSSRSTSLATSARRAAASRRC